MTNLKAGATTNGHRAEPPALRGKLGDIRDLLDVVMMRARHCPMSV